MSQHYIFGLILVPRTEVGLLLSHDGDDARLWLACRVVADEGAFAGLSIVGDTTADGGGSGVEDRGMRFRGIRDEGHLSHSDMRSRGLRRRRGKGRGG